MPLHPCHRHPEGTFDPAAVAKGPCTEWNTALRHLDDCRCFTHHEFMEAAYETTNEGPENGAQNPEDPESFYNVFRAFVGSARFHNDSIPLGLNSSRLWEVDTFQQTKVYPYLTIERQIEFVTRLLPQWKKWKERGVSYLQPIPAEYSDLLEEHWKIFRNAPKDIGDQEILNLLLITSVTKE